MGDHFPKDADGTFADETPADKDSNRKIYACRIVKVEDNPGEDNSVQAFLRTCRLSGSPGSRRLELTDQKNDFTLEPKDLWDFDDLRDWVLGSFGWLLYYPEISELSPDLRQDAWIREVSWAMMPEAWPWHREKADTALKALVNRT